MNNNKVDLENVITIWNAILRHCEDCYTELASLEASDKEHNHDDMWDLVNKVKHDAIQVYDDVRFRGKTYEMAQLELHKDFDRILDFRILRLSKVIATVGDT